jgi:hypothetical protein
VSFVWPSSLVRFGSLVKEVVNQDGRKKGVASIVLSTTEHGEKAEGETHSPSLAHELSNQRRHWPINSEALLWYLDICEGPFSPGFRFETKVI